MAGRHTPGIQPPRQAPPHHQIQGLLRDHKEMTTIHAALKQDLTTMDHDIRQLATTARKVRDERDSQVKELYQKSLNLEAEVRGIDTLHSEHAQVIADIQKLNESKNHLVSQFKDVDDELSRVKADVAQVDVIMNDVDSMKQELIKGRAAVEFEKKTRAENLELRQAMDRKLNSLQREIEMLRAELPNAEKRARAAAAAAASASNSNPGYMGNYGTHSMTYGGTPYAVQYSMHQGQLTADGAPPALYVRSPATAASHGPFDSERHLPKG